MTAGRPGAEASGPPAAPDLARPPIVFDPRALNVLEGVRAALAVAVIVALATALQRSSLMLAALGAMLTCLADPGGPLPRRLTPLLAFGFSGALILGGFGLLRGLPIPIALSAAGLMLFALSFLRVYGLPAQQTGNLLSVVLILALDAPLPDLGAGLAVAGLFLAGSLWALLLTLLIWPVHPYAPVREALAMVWQQLAGFARDLARICEQPPGHAWDEHARVHRRAVRQATEAARTMLADAVSARGRAGGRAAQGLIRLAAAEQAFGALIGLAEMLESAGQAERRHGRRFLGHATALFGVIAGAIRADRPLATRKVRRAAAALESAMTGGGLTEGLNRAVKQNHRAGWESAGNPIPLETNLAAAEANPALAQFARTIAQRIVLASTVSAAAALPPGAPIGAAPSLAWRPRLIDPLAANLHLSSAAFRHALRVALVGTPALAATAAWTGPLGHWLTIALLLTMQPYFALTWVRAFERIGGTVAGGLVAAAISTVARTPLAIAAVLFPLSIIAFTLRRVSFGMFMAALTPMIVVLVEVSVPGASELTIALDRAFYTLIGGALAVVGTLVLWPSFEPERLEQEVRAAIIAHGRYGRAVLSLLLGEQSGAGVEAARRAAGLASNNLEASLQRALNEPSRRHARRFEVSLLADATLRRIAGRMTAMREDATLPPLLPRPLWAAWRDWIDQAMQAAAARQPPPPRPALPDEAAGHRAGQALLRIAGQAELLADARQGAGEGDG